MDEETKKFIYWMGQYDIYKFYNVNKWHWQGKGTFTLEELYKHWCEKQPEAPVAQPPLEQ